MFLVVCFKKVLVLYITEKGDAVVEKRVNLTLRLALDALFQILVEEEGEIL